MKDQATDIHPATAPRWPDLEKLFGPNGAYSNCWCMWWRLRHRDFRLLQPAERKAELRRWVRSGAEPGLIAYRKGIPVGWCAVAPRSEYAGLAASRNLKPVDSAAGVWSVTCYFVAQDQRRTGLMAALLGAAERHAKRHGGRILEGYPVAAERLTGCAGYTGVVPVYERAGFRVVAQPSGALRIMRKTLRPTIVQLWNFSDPSESERRFRDAMAGARGGLRLELETQIARTYSLRKRFDDAHKLLDEIEPRLKDAGLKPRLRYLLERGRTFNSSGDKAGARPLFVRAWELARDGEEEDLAIDAAHMVAIVEGGEKALQWNLMALPLATSAKDVEARRWKASLLNNTGYELKVLGRYDEALGYFEQALLAYEERGDKDAIRIAQWMIANALRLLGKFDAALAIQLRLEKEFAADGRVDGYVLEEIAELYKSLRDRAKARSYSRRAAEQLGKDR